MSPAPSLRHHTTCVPPKPSWTGRCSQCLIFLIKENLIYFPLERVLITKERAHILEEKNQFGKVGHWQNMLARYLLINTNSSFKPKPDINP